MKRTIPIFLVVALAFIVPASSAKRSGGTSLRRLDNAFVPDCPPPFASASPRRVDVSCGNEGVFEGNATVLIALIILQCVKRGSFCAKGSGGTVATDAIPSASSNLPEDRNALKDIATNASGTSIGEGSYVVFTGFMLDAHRTSKESVSCQNGTVGFVDVHILTRPN